MAFWCKGKKEYCNEEECNSCKFENGSGGIEFEDDDIDGIIISQWISVKERLPETEWEDNQHCSSEMVLATTSGSILFGYFYVYKYNGTWEFVSYDEDMDFDRCVTVTHWMPLPSTEGLNDDT